MTRWLAELRVFALPSCCKRHPTPLRYSNAAAGHHFDEFGIAELVPLFDVAQPTLSHHLKKLREAGIVDCERRGLWAYYYVLPDALQELSAWLT